MFRNGQRFWGKLLHQLDALEILKIDIDKKCYSTKAMADE